MAAASVSPKKQKMMAAFSRAHQMMQSVRALERDENEDTEREDEEEEQDE